MDFYSSLIPNLPAVCAIADMENIPPFLPSASQTPPLCGDNYLGFLLGVAAQHCQGTGNTYLELYATSLRDIFFSVCCPGPFQGWAPSLGRVTGMTWAHRCIPCLILASFWMSLPLPFALPALFCFSPQHFKWAFKASTEQLYPVRRTMRRQMKEGDVSRAKCRVYLHGPMQCLQG